MKKALLQISVIFIILLIGISNSCLAAVNLVISGGVVPNSMYRSQSYPITISVKNTGTNSTSISFYINVSINTVSSYNGNQTYLTDIYVSGGVPAGVTKTFNTTVTIPCSYSIGTRYILAGADANNDVFEFNGENDNNLPFGVLIKTGVDLTPLTYSLSSSSIAPGNSLTTNFSVNNNGGSSASGFVVGFYLSSSTTLVVSNATYLGGYTVSSLSACTQTISLNKSLTIPSSTCAGTYYIHLWIDNGQAVTEIDDNNNFQHRTITVTGTSPPAPSSCTASIGSPANGVSHYTNLSCSSVSGVDGYSYDYSLNGSSWMINWYQTSSNAQFPINNGDNPNTPLYYRVRTYKCGQYSSYRNASPQPIYTACDFPAVPTVNGATPNSLNVRLNTETPVANPNYTTYAIYCPTVSKYVHSDGTLGNGAFYQTKASWGTKTVTGLAPNMQYCFYAMALNFTQDDARYDPSNAACGTTTSGCAPYFTFDPQSIQVCTNSTANFYATASSSSAISYQWKKGNISLANGSKYQGVTTNHLTIYNCTSSDIGNYSCVATSCSLSTQSTSASLSVTGTISPDPNFHSSANNVNAGTLVTLSANNPCGGCSYSWQKTGGSFVGSSTGQNVTLYFPSPGTFTFRLTVTGPSCNPISRSSTGYVTVRPTPNVQAQMPISHAIGNEYPSGYAADPINLATGTYGFSRTLSKFKVIGGELNFTVFYNSYASIYTAANMGFNWSHSFDWRIYRQSYVDPQNQTTRDTIWRVHYPDLHETDFIVLYNGGGKSFPLHHGVFEEVTQDTVTGNLHLRMKDQTILNFNNAGILQNIVDRNNNVTTLTYNAGKLTSVIGPGGRRFNFNYTGGFLTSVTDPTNQITFGYTGNDLTSMSDGEVHNTIFTYNAFHEMENVRNPLGNYLLKNRYVNHKVDSQEDGNSTITSFHYNNPVLGATTVDYPDGSNAVFYHDTLYRLIRHKDEANFNTYTIYDYNHLPISITDVSGFETTALYDSVGNQIEVHKPHGINIFRHYNSTNDITQVVDGEGNVTSYNRDARGNILNINRPGNNDESFSYSSANGQILSHTNGRNISSSFSHNSFGDLTQVNAPKGIWHFSYDGRGRNTSVKNPLGDSTITTYDGNDKVLIEKDEEGFTVVHSYDANKNEVSFIDKNSHPTTFVYDLKDRPYIIRDIYNGEKKIEYNFRDVKTKFTDERGKYVQFNVTTRGDITSVRNKLGGVTNITQSDNAGNPINFINTTSGVTVNRILDSLYRETDITIGGIVNNKKSYNRNSKIKQYIDGRNHPKNVKFDGVSRPDTVIDELGHPTIAAYDGNNNLTSLTDPNGVGHTTSIIYDTEDNDSLTTDANGLTQRKIYNALGDLITLIKPQDTVNFTYYKNHRLKDVVFSTGESFHYYYDGNGNVTTAIGPNGTEQYVYNYLNRPTSYTDFNTNTIEYTYNEIGNPRTIKYPGPGNKIAQYTYNDMGQVLSVTAVWLNKTWSFEYDTPGNLIKINYPNNYKTQISRDPAGRVEKYKNYYSITQQTIYQDSVWRDGNANVDSNAVTGWWPDSLAHHSRHYTHQNNNIMVTDGESNFTSNNNGALERQIFGNDTLNYSWSANDILMAMSGGGNSIAFKYDAFFRLAGQTGNGYETRYVNDISQSLPRVIMTQNSGGTATGYYIYGNGLVGMIDSAGNIFNYHHDLYGNTVFLTNDTGTVTDKYTYTDPFGKLYKHEGISKQPFLFLGRYGIIAINDSIYNIRARFYQSTTGRFISKDPYTYDILSSQTIHRYVYGLNNPLSMMDVSGLCSEGNNTYLSAPNNNWFYRVENSIYNFGLGGVQGIQDAFSLAAFKPGQIESIEYTYSPSYSSGYKVFGALAGIVQIPFAFEERAALGVVQYSDDLVRTAQLEYPNLAGKTQLHHPIPKYLGGAEKQALVPLDAAYHQKITNAFREAWPYKQANPSTSQLQNILNDVYNQFPLPPGY